MRSNGSKWANLESDAASVAEVQEALTRSELSAEVIDASLRARLRVFAARLRKVQSWAGAYSDIELSPEVKAILAEHNDHCPSDQSPLAGPKKVLVY